MGLEILFYVPNIIGYVRLILMGVSCTFYHSNPATAFWLYLSSISLDYFDGWAARRFNQTSAYGAWLDVTIDNLSRAMLWCKLYSYGFLVSSLEWCCFVCTHSLGRKWKTSFVKEPWFVERVMAQNFKTPLGTAAISGLHILPLWLYGYHSDVLTSVSIPLCVQNLGVGVLCAARLLCATVEVWCIWSHILYLTSEEANKTNTKSHRDHTHEPS